MKEPCEKSIVTCMVRSKLRESIVLIVPFIHTIHAYKHSDLYVYGCVYVRVRVRVRSRVRVCAYVQEHVHAHVFECVLVCFYVGVCTPVCIYILHTSAYTLPTL